MWLSECKTCRKEETDNSRQHDGSLHGGGHEESGKARVQHSQSGKARIEHKQKVDLSACGDCLSCGNHMYEVWDHLGLGHMKKQGCLTKFDQR